MSCVPAKTSDSHPPPPETSVGKFREFCRSQSEIVRLKRVSVSRRSVGMAGKGKGGGGEGSVVLKWWERGEGVPCSRERDTSASRKGVVQNEERTQDPTFGESVVVSLLLGPSFSGSCSKHYLSCVFGPEFPIAFKSWQALFVRARNNYVFLVLFVSGGGRRGMRKGG